MGISLSAVLLTVATITAYLIYDMRIGKEQELVITAGITGDRNLAALEFMDNAAAHANLEIFRLNPAIQVACIYDAHGALFSNYTHGQSSLSCPLESNLLAMHLPDMLIVKDPILRDQERVGDVYLVSDTREIDTYVHKIMLISGASIALVLALTLLLTSYFQRTISGPILELAQTVQSITTGHDYTMVANTNYPNEPGILAKAFNEMLGEVHRRDLELKKANETLEEKVKHRTHELEFAKQRAEAANDAKTEFLRNMSHEFRTPLHAILNFSAYGAKEYESAEREQLKKYFEIVGRGSERLSRMVNRVLDLARLESGTPIFLTERHDMGELVSRAAELMRSLLEEKSISLRFYFEAEIAGVVCDPDKITQVITNLLGNAIKFSPVNGKITVRIRSISEKGNPQMVVSVIDEGVGIPDNELDMIFESFRQSSRTNTGAGGTGLGLAICRSIVSEHGGRIWAENNPIGTGATLNFMLPFTQREARILTVKEKGESHENAA